MKENWKRIILHVDMDAFFAAVEELLHPEWRGKPLVVGADPKGGKGRGVVSTANYEARKYGVHSAMPISRAYRLCPHAIYVEPHGRLYQEYSRMLFAVLEKFSPRIEPLSIDEAFLDMTGTLHLFGSVEKMGRELKEQIHRATGLTASVGIAPVKSVAKIASDFNKPDGLTIVPPSQVQTFLDPLPITRLWGVGQKTFDVLHKLGIETVAQLRKIPLEVLEAKFGKMGAHIFRMARGLDEREVEPEETVKSVSNEITFEKDQSDWELIHDTVFRLSEKVAGRLRRAGIAGRTVHLKIRFQDFKTYTRSQTLNRAVQLTEDIFSIASQLLQEFEESPRAVRLLGVGVSHLESRQAVQLSLWEEEDRKKLKLEQVMDQLQDKFGQGVIMHARSLRGKPRHS